MNLDKSAAKRSMPWFESNVGTKRKTPVSPTPTITRLESLSNEVICEIFDYLDGCAIYEAFSSLNVRFRNLLISPYFRLKLNVPFTSKPVFLRHCTELIAPNIDRIVSLCLSNHCTTDLFLDSFAIDSFLQLEALILDGVHHHSLLPLLTRLAALPRLTSLSITCPDYVREQSAVYRGIFRLPTLNYCKLNILIDNDPTSLPTAFDEQDRCQTLEYLIIDGSCSLHQLNAILSYTPRLTHLSCKIENEFQSTENQAPIVPFGLTHLFLDFDDIPFKKFELFLAKISGQLQVLRVTTSLNRTFLRADLWKRLISSHMPHLRVFDFQYTLSEYDQVNKNTRNENKLITRFFSTFWFARQWFFAYQYWPRDDDGSCLRFYSTHPYRRKHYELYEYDNEEIDVDAVRHLTIGGHSGLSKCSTLFSNVTQLTLIENDIQNIDQFITDLHRLVHLTQLTHLVIQEQDLAVDQLMELLRWTSNIRSLTFALMASFHLHPLSDEESDIFRSISKSNTVTEVVIKHDCTLEHVQFLVDLCPRMQRLEIGVKDTELELIVRFVLSKRSQHLFSLCLLETSHEMVVKIQTLIDQHQLLGDYSIKRVGKTLSLWW